MIDDIINTYANGQFTAEDVRLNPAAYVDSPLRILQEYATALLSGHQFVLKKTRRSIKTHIGIEFMLEDYKIGNHSSFTYDDVISCVIPRISKTCWRLPTAKEIDALYHAFYDTTRKYADQPSFDLLNLSKDLTSVATSMCRAMWIQNPGEGIKLFKCYHTFKTIIVESTGTDRLYTYPIRLIHK